MGEQHTSPAALIDDLLMQEVQSLREQIRILTRIVLYYEPGETGAAIIHAIGTCDDLEYRQDLAACRESVNG